MKSLGMQNMIVAIDVISTEVSLRAYNTFTHIAHLTLARHVFCCTLGRQDDHPCWGEGGNVNYLIIKNAQARK